ncbi:MAG: diguanylate cyclase, partial [Lachnospiraceae bacterium]|nr:diguanylate cyclase [Lachnospiraceae bacterium]
MGTVISTEYNEFLKENRITVNRYLNRALWFFALTGPAIASGIRGGIFHDITYTTCIGITAVVLVMASIHLLLLRTQPSSMVTGIFALTALDMLLVYMSHSHVSIYLTWFLVPLLSLLYCDKGIFFYSFFLNYILMLGVTYVNSFYKVTLRADYDEPQAYFADVMSGFTIESIIMCVSAYIIGKLTLRYFKALFRQNEKIRRQDVDMREKMDILVSMSEIYENVNLIDFVSNTEMSLRDSEYKKHPIDLQAQTHSRMNQRIMKTVMPDQVDDFMAYTNLKTIRSRLSHKKVISADFIDVISGWFRAQYITVDSTLDGIPNVIIYTTRNVDEEKQREEHLIRISMTDEMTRLFNRRCFDEDLRELRKSDLPDDFVLFAMDVNGLKRVNDEKGHAAGDELIKGAAECWALSIGTQGQVYRTGGDDGMAISH